MEYLLSDQDEVQRSFVIQLMEKYGLAVPIHDDDPLHVAVSNNMPPCALKSSMPLCSHLQEFDCPVPQQQIRQLGFLPHGLFERLLGKVLTWSQVTCRVFPDNQIHIVAGHVRPYHPVVTCGGRRSCTSDEKSVWASSRVLLSYCIQTLWYLMTQPCSSHSMWLN